MIHAKREAGSAPSVTPELEARIHGLQGRGQGLPLSARAFFEPRFGHDFSRVRIHADAPAAEAARAIQARAFTIGRDIVFAPGEYAPATGEGRRLLAHELTHVVQQGAHASGAMAGVGSAAIQRLPFGTSQDPASRHGSTLPYREATDLLTCIRIMGEENAAYCRQQVLGEKPPPAPPQICDPDRSLTWADFRGNPQPGSFGASTSWLPPALVTEGGQQIVLATFNPALSWVRPQFANPANRAVNGCASQVGSCQKFFGGLTAGQTGTWNLGAPQGCAASVSPNTSLTATSRAECAGILGAECDRTAQLESVRLLAHEQLHFDIVCVLARKGTQAIAAGAAAQTVLTAVRNKAGLLSSSNGKYDTETGHGCNATTQASWAADVAAGLPTVTIP